MSITYPLEMPTSINAGRITFRAQNAVAVNTSPFSFSQQVVRHPGQRWEADVEIPPVRKEQAEDWVLFLLKLRGQFGTFLLYDYDRTEPTGSPATVTLSGTKGDETVTVSVGSGVLTAGDYISLGSGTSTRLHRIVGVNSATSIDIWPKLRVNYTTATVDTSTPKGVFRLANNTTEWTINDINAYGISFKAVEAL